MLESLQDAQLGAIVDARDSLAVSQIQGFHYAQNYVIRDCLREYGKQVIWTGPDSMEAAVFARQCEIERLRVAVAIALTNAPSTALAEAEARGYARGLEWQPIETAPYGQEVRVKAGEMTFLAMLVKDASMLEDETPCDQWQATREGEHPPCWSDGACWASNADDCASLQPTGWVSDLATTPAETQKPETGESAR